MSLCMGLRELRYGVLLLFCGILAIGLRIAIVRRKRPSLACFHPESRARAPLRSAQHERIEKDPLTLSLSKGAFGTFRIGTSLALRRPRRESRAVYVSRRARARPLRHGTVVVPMTGSSDREVPQTEPRIEH
jgi:hypothetical protein